MKRLLISSVMFVALSFAGVTQADGYRDNGHPPGIQKHLERGKAMPPGHQKKFLRSEWRDKHDRHSDNKRRDKWHDARYDRRDHRDSYRDNNRYDHRHGHRDDHRSAYRDRRDHNWYRDGYRASFGYSDRLAPEHRVARIIRDTQVLIDQSRR